MAKGQKPKPDFKPSAPSTLEQDVESVVDQGCDFVKAGETPRPHK